MNTLQFAFWDHEPRLHDDLYASLKVFYYRIPLVSASADSMLWSGDLDKILVEADANANWLCVVRVGTLFSAQDVIVDLVRKACDQVGQDCLIFGEPGTLLLVNLARWRSQSSMSTRVLLQQERPPLPEFLKNEVICAEDRGLEDLNHNLSLLYQMKDLRGAQQRQTLGWLFNRRFGLDVKHLGGSVNLRDVESKVFLFNTEEMIPDMEWTRRFAKPVDHYLGPCSGFFDVATLFAHGFKPHTRVTQYDFNQKSLEIKKRFIEKFNGRLDELIPFCREIFSDYPETPFYFRDPAFEMERILRVFGSKDLFFEAWQKLRDLQIEYLHLNLVSNFSTLFSRIRTQEQTVFLISDIFTGQNELTYGRTVISSRYREFLAQASEFENLIVSGKNKDGHPIIGWAKDLS